LTRLARALRGVRPLEWASLAFVAFVFVRAGPKAFLGWQEFAADRTVTIIAALGLVAFVLLARQFSTLPWPTGAGRKRRRHRLWLLLAALPAGAVTGLAVAGPVFHPVLREPFIFAVCDITVPLGRSIGVAVPGLLVWLAAGIELKRHGNLAPGRFLAGWARQLGVAVRDWAPLLFAVSAYAWMGSVIDAAPARRLDDAMQAADLALFFGHDPHLALERIIWEPLSEWMAFSYSFYALLYPLSLGAALLYGGRTGQREVSFAVGFALLVAYIGYISVPVAGPVFTRTFTVSLDMQLMGPVKAAMMDATRIELDCFPSVHTCASVLLAWGLWRHARRLFWAVAPMAATIPVACVYLRYHYVVDVLAGLALAAATLALTRWLRPWLLADLAPAPGAAAPAAAAGDGAPVPPGA
jgi:membrane-associated phospholipid phosphatase